LDSNPLGLVAPTVEAALAFMGDPPAYPDGQGFYAPIRAALSAAIRADGSRVDQASLLAKIDSALNERGHTRPQAYITDRMRDRRRWLEWYVRRAFENEAASAVGPGICDPPSQRPAIEPEAAAAMLDAAAGAFMAEVLVTCRVRQSAFRDGAAGNSKPSTQSMPPQGQAALLAAGVAGGKTEVALRHIGQFLSVTELRGNPNRRVVYNTPDHKLASDIAGRFRALAPSIECYVHLGADRPDPDHPDFTNPAVPEGRKTRMCRRSDMLGDVRAAGGSIETLCGSASRGYCPHHPDSPAAAEHGVCGRMATKAPKSGLVVLAGPDAPTEGAARPIESLHRNQIP
jgi:hypothetical protein